MNTQSHALIALALLDKRDNAPVIGRAVLIGALLPDAFLAVFFSVGMLNGIPQTTLWSETYWRPVWQNWSAISNSFILAGVVLAAGGVLRSRMVWLVPATLAALLHQITDFLTHAEDAHQHFWPLTAWRFQSPVSYWDPAHFGQTFAVFELVLGLGLCVLLWRRYRRTLPRAALAFSAVAYIAVPLAWLWAMSA